jgi:hypothetical protein
VAGCGEDGGGPADPDGDQQQGIPTDLTDPAAVLDSHAQALEQKDLDAYVALLEPEPAGRSAEPGFRFYPLDTDADDFPWMTGDSWGVADESRFIGNMFDPEFAGEQPPVESISMDFQILSQREVTPGEQEISITALFIVLTGPDQGFAVDTKFIFLLAEQADGFYRIREIRELPRQKRIGFAALEATSWARVKGLYG